MQTIGVSPAPIAADRLAIDDRVGLAEQPPPLGVADDHVLGAGFLDHRRRHLAGERAFALPVDDPAPRRRCSMLRAASATACTAVNGGATTISHVDDVLDDALQLFDEDDRFLHGLEHLPVAGDEGDSHR